MVHRVSKQSVFYCKSAQRAALKNERFIYYKLYKNWKMFEDSVIENTENIYIIHQTKLINPHVISLPSTYRFILSLKHITPS